MHAQIPSSEHETVIESGRFRLRWRHLGAWLVVAIGLFAASVTLGVGSSAEAQGNGGVLFGAFVNADDNQTQIEGYQELERQLGTKLPIIREFSTWEDNLDNRLHNWIVDGDRQLMLSIKPIRDNGNKISWRSIANAKPGSRLHNEMVELARDVRNLDGDVWIAFHHEPEAGNFEDYGNSGDFIAAWRKIHGVFEQQNADAEWVWTMTAWSFNVKDSDKRAAEKWYPGDAFVDYLGADAYNWNQCRNQRETWSELEASLRGFLEFSDAHPTKQLVLPEFGSAEGSSGAKAGWLNRAAAFLKESDNADRFAAVLYFSSEHKGVPRCNWWADSSTSALNAARNIAQDPFFSRNGQAGQAVAVVAPARNVGITCTVRSTNNGDLVEWSDNGPGWRYNVRRNDKWLGATDDNRLRNEKANNGSYVVIARKAGEGRTDTTCSRV